MTLTLLSQPAPLGAASPAIPLADSALRLSLHPVPNRRAVVDGAWWPYSREPVVLLIIPPGTAAGAAEAALELTAQDTAGLTPDDILTLANLPSGPAARRALHAVPADSSAN